MEMGDIWIFGVWSLVLKDEGLGCRVFSSKPIGCFLCV